MLKDVSAWVASWSHLIETGATVLDVACGSGRHTRWFASRGARVTALDRDAAGIEGLRDIAFETVVADIEADPWPLPGRQFDAVVVTNYLHRPLMPLLLQSVAESGVLIYETFALGQADIGKPSNPNFLLRPGELLATTHPFQVVAYEDGFDPGLADGSTASPARFVQRIVAVRAPAATSLDTPGFPRLPLRSRAVASG